MLFCAGVFAQSWPPSDSSRFEEWKSAGDKQLAREANRLWSIEVYILAKLTCHILITIHTRAHTLTHSQLAREANSLWHIEDVRTQSSHETRAHTHEQFTRTHNLEKESASSFFFLRLWCIWNFYRFKDVNYSYMNPSHPFDVTIAAPEGKITHCGGINICFFYRYFFVITFFVRHACLYLCLL